MRFNWLSQAFSRRPSLKYYPCRYAIFGWYHMVGFGALTPGYLSGTPWRQNLGGCRGISESDLRLNAELAECLRRGNAPNLRRVEILQATVGRTNWNY